MKKNLVAILVCTMLATTIVSALPSNSQQKNLPEPTQIDWWPQLGHDAAHTGFSSSIAPETNERFLETKLQFNDNPDFPPSMTVVDGRLYIAGMNEAYCCNAYTGSLVWRVPYGSGYFMAPAVADGNIYLSNNGVGLTCLKQSSGTFQWRTLYPMNGPVTVANGNIYFGTSQDITGYNHLYCLDTNGAEIWNVSFSSSPSFYTSPAVSDGKVFFITLDLTKIIVHCFDASTGIGIWEYAIDSIQSEWLQSSSPVVSNNKVFFTASNINTDHYVFCLDATGNEGTTTLLWSTLKGWNPSYQFSAPVAVTNNRCYFFTISRTDEFASTVFCIDATTGDDIWTFPYSFDLLSSPSIAGGKVFFSYATYSGGGGVYCLDAEGNGDGTTDMLWSYTTNDVALDGFLGPILGRGKMWVSGVGLNIIGFGTGTNTAPPTPAPPTGPSQGFSGEKLTFSACAIDPDDDQLWYQWKCGSEISDWVGVYDSNEVVEHSTRLMTPGMYNVRVRVRDYYDAESGWSNPLLVTIIPNNMPNAPSQPVGSSIGSVGQDLSFSSAATDPDGHQVQLGWDWNDDNVVDDWSQFVDSGASITGVHHWLSEGTCFIKVRAMDTCLGEGPWSQLLQVTITVNPAPNNPEKPSGPISGIIGTNYPFETITTDPNNQRVSYQWNWGDEISDWTPLTQSGVMIVGTHSWSEEGYYGIQVRAKDEFGVQSDWSAVHIIMIQEPSSPSLRIAMISGGVKTVGVIIENTGAADAVDIDWSITATGGFFKHIQVTKSDTFVSLSAGGRIIVTTDSSILGFGLIDITVTVDNLQEEAVGLVLGKYVIVLGVV